MSPEVSSGTVDWVPVHEICPLLELKKNGSNNLVLPWVDVDDTEKSLITAKVKLYVAE